MQKLGKLIYTLRKASSDFQFSSVHKKSCMTYLMYSAKLNQIVAIKIPNREFYITKGLALKYLQFTRKTLFKEYGQSICKKAYVLNILISDKLTKSCYELIAIDVDKKNFDMLFIPKKPSDEEIILGAIFEALSTKCQSWITHIKTGCKNKNIAPFNDVRNKIKDIEKAADIFHQEFLRSKGKGETRKG